MRDAIQWGTLILVGFGIMLSRYDANAICKEMTDLQKELTERLDKQTTTVVAMLFKHEGRIIRVETKTKDKE